MRRHQFDFGAPDQNFQFLDNLYIIIPSNLIDTLNDSNTHLFDFASSNGVMSQVVLDKDANKIYIYLLKAIAIYKITNVAASRLCKRSML